MTDWKEGVQYSIAEIANIRDRHNDLILAIDEFNQKASKHGVIVPELQEMKSRLEGYIVELNQQSEKQKA